MDSARTTTDRVSRVRRLMREQGLDGLIVRSTDRFLNEYVPRAESTRVWLTGFSGSAGDAYLTHEQGWLAVDGRYYVQAAEQIEGTPFVLEKVPLGTSIAQVVQTLVVGSAAAGVKRVGYAPDRVSVKDLRALEAALAGEQVELVPTSPSLLERARGPVAETLNPVRLVVAAVAGLGVAAKVARVWEALEGVELEAFVVQRLDELAWLTNLRGKDLPFQATFRGLGLLLPDRVVLATEASRLPDLAGAPVEVVTPDAWTGLVPAGRVGFDPEWTTAAVVRELEARGAEPVACPSPVVPLKARKTPAVVAVMRESFRKADQVVEQAIAWVAARLDEGERVTEADLADEIHRLFLESGAVGLSFKTIAAAGANGAIVHYSDPDPEREILPTELVLVDVGGYYHDGYATDLTRTFLAGSRGLVPAADQTQRERFTRVLRAAIAGMSARVPQGTRGDQLDTIVRAPLWSGGEDYGHGTGHGVGINVHEAPPRISTRCSQPLEVGHVFSIEPGLYEPGEFGIRIENLCTVVESTGAPGFLDVVPLTFAALDDRLVATDMLTAREATWLQDYVGEREERRETQNWGPSEDRPTKRLD